MRFKLKLRRSEKFREITCTIDGEKVAVGEFVRIYLGIDQPIRFEYLEVLCWIGSAYFNVTFETSINSDFECLNAQEIMNTLEEKRVQIWSRYTMYFSEIETTEAELSR